MSDNKRFEVLDPRTGPNRRQTTLSSKNCGLAIYTAAATNRALGPGSAMVVTVGQEALKLDTKPVAIASSPKRLQLTVLWKTSAVGSSMNAGCAETRGFDASALSSHYPQYCNFKQYGSGTIKRRHD